MTFLEKNDAMLSSDSDEVHGETTATESAYNDQNAIILTFTLMRPAFILQRSRFYYVSLTSPEYHINKSTEKCKAPGGFVTPFVLPPTIPAQAFVYVRLHQDETQFRVAKFHETKLRVERIRYLIESHLTLDFKGAPNLVMHVEKPPSLPQARALLEGTPRFIGNGFCGAGTSVSCATVVSRRRADGTWAPVLHQDILSEGCRHRTPLLYEPSSLDSTLLRIDAFTIRKTGHRRLRRRATMLCSLRLLLNAETSDRWILHRAHGYNPRTITNKIIGNFMVAGLLDFQILSSSSSGLTTFVKVDIVLFGCFVTLNNFFDFNYKRCTEAPPINMPPPMDKHSRIGMQILKHSGGWQTEHITPESAALSHAPKSVEEGNTLELVPIPCKSKKSDASLDASKMAEKILGSLPSVIGSCSISAVARAYLPISRMRFLTNVIRFMGTRS